MTRRRYFPDLRHLHEAAADARRDYQAAVDLGLAGSERRRHAALLEIALYRAWALDTVDTAAMNLRAIFLGWDRP